MVIGHVSYKLTRIIIRETKISFIFSEQYQVFKHEINRSHTLLFMVHQFSILHQSQLVKLLNRLVQTFVTVVKDALL